jgi:hypothetical protein
MLHVYHSITLHHQLSTKCSINRPVCPVPSEPAPNIVMTPPVLRPPYSLLVSALSCAPCADASDRRLLLRGAVAVAELGALGAVCTTPPIVDSMALMSRRTALCPLDVAVFESFALLQRPLRLVPAIALAPRARGRSLPRLCVCHYRTLASGKFSHLT